jgi:hypothetical protein
MHAQEYLKQRTAQQKAAVKSGSLCREASIDQYDKAIHPIVMSIIHDLTTLIKSLLRERLFQLMKEFAEDEHKFSKFTLSGQYVELIAGKIFFKDNMAEHYIEGMQTILATRLKDQPVDYSYPLRVQIVNYDINTPIAPLSAAYQDKFTLRVYYTSC